MNKTADKLLNEYVETGTQIEVLKSKRSAIKERLIKECGCTPGEILLRSCRIKETGVESASEPKEPSDEVLNALELSNILETDIELLIQGNKIPESLGENIVKRIIAVRETLKKVGGSE
ncbi:hypothetical protein ACK8P5_26500 (plasmid) [Paenibacillus sp. EC2-1]|uniref:hypothetical protein n=1 Tax=Paenibacillus sp. EC2-1 TaxID=3388665 RepID=UPI003BEEC75B